MSRSAARALRLVFLGPPGSGKGTQAKVLEVRFGARQISTGDLLRKHVADGTPLGLEAKKYMDSGGLVPDDVMIGMMEQRVADENGFVLDGFPRTVPQAVALDAMLARLAKPLTAVVLFEADRPTLLRRLGGRWTNPRTGRTYHDAFSPPKVAGLDDDDGGPLVQRPDDTSEVVTKRLQTYDEQTSPLIDYYDGRRSLVRVNGLKSIDDVSADLERIVGARDGAPA
jgi:adenylate kinase